MMRLHLLLKMMKMTRMMTVVVAVIAVVDVVVGLRRCASPARSEGLFGL